MPDMALAVLFAVGVPSEVESGRPGAGAAFSGCSLWDCSPAV